MSRRGMLDIVVVGAGVVGASAALAFARDGLQVALVEAGDPEPWRIEAPDLRVYAIAPDNAALLGQLGVWPAILAARAQPYRAMQVWDAAGGDALRFDADRFARRELGWIVEHGLLVDRLWAALASAGVGLHCPDRVVALAQDESSATLETHSGLRLRTKLVVAADGAGSQLRTLAGVATRARDYRQRGLVAFIETGEPHAATCFQRFLPGGPLAFLPFADADGDGVAGQQVACGSSGHRSSIVWTLPDAEAGRMLLLDDAAFDTELARAFDGPLGTLRVASSRVAFPLRRQLAHAHAAGRVALVGDAAHVVHPLAGQGVNLGLRDVAALRSRLANAIAVGGDVGAAAGLARWARERRSENTLAAYAFDGINRWFSNDAVAATLLRGPLLGMAGKLPPLARALWRQAAGL